MKKKVLYFFLAAFLFVFPTTRLNAIPVHDSLLMAELLGSIGEEIAKWSEYIGLFTNYLEKFERFANGVRESIQGLNLDELKALSPIDINEFWNQWYFLDSKKKDTWHDILNRIASLTKKYPSLLSNTFVTQSVLYQENYRVREVMDTVIQHQKDDVTDIENLTTMLADFKEWESRTKERLEKFGEYLDKFSSGNGQISFGSKLEALEGQMELEALQMQLKRNLLQSKVYQLELKQHTRAWEIGNLVRNGGADAK